MDDLSTNLTRLIVLVYEEELRLLRSAGRSVTEHYILQVLAANPGITMTELSKRLSLAKSSGSVAVDALVKKKMVIRRQDREDRRRVALFLTRRGEQTMARFWQKKAGTLEGALSHLSNEERRVAARVFKSAAQALAEKKL